MWMLMLIRQPDSRMRVRSWNAWRVHDLSDFPPLVGVANGMAVWSRDKALGLRIPLGESFVPLSRLRLSPKSHRPLVKLAGQTVARPTELI